MQKLIFCTVCNDFVPLKECTQKESQPTFGLFPFAELKLYNHTCGTTISEPDYPDPVKFKDIVELIDFELGRIRRLAK